MCQSDTAGPQAPFQSQREFTSPLTAASFILRLSPTAGRTLHTQAAHTVHNFNFYVTLYYIYIMAIFIL